MARNVNVLQLAFAYGRMLRVIGSDRVVEPSELTYLHGRFPDDLLASCGFLEADGRLSAEFDATLEEARATLPSRLTEGQKLALMELLVDAAASDGVLAAEEADLLFDAARDLGVDGDAWTSHLKALFASGRVRRDDTGV